MKNISLDIMEDIVDRAEIQGLLIFNRISLIMDLDCVSARFTLRLCDLLNASDFDFTHDILGIQKNLNRETLDFENHFMPRFAISK